MSSTFNWKFKGAMHEISVHIPAEVYRHYKSKKRVYNYSQYTSEDEGYEVVPVVANALVEKAMLDYFPEVISLRVIPVGDMGTADFTGGNQGLRNHIEVDLVRRTSEGAGTEPLSYKFEKKWLTSLAARVSSGGILSFVVYRTA